MPQNSKKEAFLTDIKRFYKQNSIVPKFPKTVLREIKKKKKLKTNSRVNLKHLNVFTIDPSDARDFDDALSVETKEHGIYIVGVHITDVSFWVGKGSQTDKEALKRGNSYYFPWGFVPMLPKQLSCDICSLNENEERLAVSCLFTVKGNRIIGQEFVLSVIKSKKRLTYKQAQDILDGKSVNTEPWLKESLDKLQEISNVIRKNRNKKGGLDFELPEYKILLDENLNPTEIDKNTHYNSNKIVEDFMLKTNEAVASFLIKNNMDFLFRNHPAPSDEGMREFYELCKNFEIKITGKSPSEIFRQALSEIERKQSSPILKRMFLRIMQKAIYENKNKGHFGLGIKNYTHFTSPIRRYPDLTVHRALKICIDKNSNKKRNKKRKSNLNSIGKHCTDCERKSLKMERESFKWLSCVYMKEKTGENYLGFISGINSFGVFVEIADLHIEGLVMRRYLRDYMVNEKKQMIIHRRTGKKMLIGDDVKITLKSCNVQKRFIDFAII